MKLPDSLPSSWSKLVCKYSHDKNPFNSAVADIILIQIIIQVSRKNKAAQKFAMLIMIRNVSWAANQHIIMISEGSCV